MSRLEGTFEELFEAGCIQTGSNVHDNAESAAKQFRVQFWGLMALSNFDPCTSGCPEFKDGKCQAFQKFYTGPSPAITKQSKRETPEERQARIDKAIKPPGTKKYPGLSVRKIAEKTGMSIRQVRRAKINGAI